MNTVYNHDNYYVSVAHESTYDGAPEPDNLISETALVFNDATGKQRFWILKHDVHSIYDGLSLEEAKSLYKQEHEKGNAAFWTDYNFTNDNDANT